MATVVAATVTGTAATLTLLKVGYDKFEKALWLFNKNLKINTSSWNDLKNLEEFAAFLVLIENQFNSLDEYNPVFCVSNVFLTHFYFTFAYLIEMKFQDDKTVFAESRNELVKAQRERDSKDEEQKKRRESYQRSKRKESKFEKAVKQKSREVRKSLSNSGSKVKSVLNSFGQSGIPKTGNLSAVLKENNIAEIEKARQILHNNWEDYDVVGLSTKIFQLRSRFWLLSKCLKDAGCKSAARANEFLQGFADDARLKMKEYPVDLDNPGHTLRREGENTALSDFQEAWKSFQQLIECHNEVVATEYVEDDGDLKEANVISLIPYIRAMTRKQDDIFPMIHVQKSVDAHIYEDGYKRWRAAKRPKSKQKVSKSGLMLFSESEGPEVFWEQCLIVFKTNSSDWKDQPFLKLQKAADDLDNSLHRFAQEGDLLSTQRLLQSSYITNKGNKEWKERYLNRSGKDGNTALHYALKGGHVRIAQELLKTGAKWTTVNDADETPFDIANDGELIAQLYKDSKVRKYDGVPGRDKV